MAAAVQWAEMNWVEKRAQQDELLRQNADRIWEYFRIAIRQSVESYARHYGNKRAIKVECHDDKPDLVYVDFSTPPTKESSATQAAIIVQRDGFNRHVIDVTYKYVKTPQKTLTIAVLPDGSVALADKGDPVGDDDAARLILEPIFFPVTAKSAKVSMANY